MFLNVRLIMSEKDEFEELMQEYRNSIPEKLSSIEKCIKEVHAKGDLDSIQALHMAVHKIAGSAGSYGFSEVSEIALPLAQDLRHKIENFKPLEKKWHKELDITFAKIKAAFKKN
jgi:HPt (histidine-containing phosphotransfer) domain-containing protein